MNVTCEQAGDVVIVHAGPTRLMHPSLSEFSTLVTGEIARGSRKIVINFGGVEYLDSAGAEKPVERPNITMEQATSPDFVQQSLVPLSSETHGGEDLGIYAIGPWAHLFQGTVEENYTFHVMDFASGISERLAESTH